MKRYVTWESYAEGVGSVTGIYIGAIPETIIGGMETESPMPDYVVTAGLESVLRINIETGELYYDYVKAESTETRLAQAQKELTDVQQALADTYEQLALT